MAQTSKFHLNWFFMAMIILFGVEIFGCLFPENIVFFLFSKVTKQYKYAS